MARWTKFPVNFSCYRARFATKIARDARFSVNICVRQEWNSRANISRVSTCRRCQEICLFSHFRGRRDKFETNTRHANSPVLRSGSCLVKRVPIGLPSRYSICCLISLFAIDKSQKQVNRFRLSTFVKMEKTVSFENYLIISYFSSLLSYTLYELFVDQISEEEVRQHYTNVATFGNRKIHLF